MNKKFLYCLFFFSAVLLEGSFLQPETTKTHENLKIVYLNKVSSKDLKKKPAFSNNLTEIILSNENDAYVFNKETLTLISKENADEFLNNGGVIAITDNELSSDLVKDKVTLSVPDFDFSNSNGNFQGSYIFNKNNENYLVNVATGCMTEVVDEDDENQNDFELDDSFLDEINQDELANQMIENAFNEINNNDSDLHFKIDGGGSSSSNENDGSSIEFTDTSGEVVATAYMQNLLYLEPQHTTLLCSYTIKTDIVDVAKIIDNDGIIHGMYDCRSIFTVDAEPNYAIENYKVKMESTETVVDSSYLNTNTSTTVNLGGSFGFDGTLLTGEISGGISYTYNNDSQEITNDLKAGNTKYWFSSIPSPQLNASKKLEPAIRFVSDNDQLSMTEKSRVEEFRIKNDGWWIFATHYVMMPEYRAQLNLTLNADGTFSQDIVLG